MVELYHATVKCPYCDRDIEAYDCVEISKMIQWLDKHNDFNECGARTGSGLLLTIKDWQYLLNWRRK